MHNVMHTKGHNVMHTKTKTNTEPHKQWEVYETLNQQQQNYRLTKTCLACMEAT